MVNNVLAGGPPVEGITALPDFLAGQRIEAYGRGKERRKRASRISRWQTTGSFGWYFQQEAQLMLTTGATVEVNKHSTIPYIRNCFLLCNSNFVFQMRPFYDIRLQERSWPWNWGQKSLKVIESVIIR